MLAKASVCAAFFALSATGRVYAQVPVATAPVVVAPAPAASTIPAVAVPAAPSPAVALPPTAAPAIPSPATAAGPGPIVPPATIDPVKGTWQQWTPNCGVVPIHAAYLPGDKIYMSERVHYYVPGDNITYTNAQLAALAQPPLSQWFNGNPNFESSPFMTDAAEFDGATGKYTLIDRHYQNNTVLGQLSGYAFCAGHTQIANGSYLVYGGDEFWDKPFKNQNYTSVGRADIRVFNPSTPTTPPQLTMVGKMYKDPAMQPDAPGGSYYSYWGRWYPSGITLANERVMIVGGQARFYAPDDPKVDTPTFELWDPVAGPIGPTKRINVLAKFFPVNMYPVVFQLPKSGKVWVYAANESSIVDPDTGLETPDVGLDLNSQNGLLHRSFPFAGTNFFPMISYRDQYRTEAWFCGGVNSTDVNGQPIPRDGNSNKWYANCSNCRVSNRCNWVALETPGAKFIDEDMPRARSQPAAVNLPDGTVVIINGSGRGHQGGVFGIPTAGQGVREAVIFDPSYPKGDPRRWITGAPAPTARHYHNSALLREDGTIFTGGGDSQNGDDWNTMRPDDMTLDIYYPPYKAIPNPPQLVLPLSNANVKYGQTFVVPFTAPVGSTIQQVSIIRYASMTHTVNNDQRHVELEVLKWGQTKVLVRLPANGQIAPPGNWMLWAVDNRGAPVARAGTINLRAGNPGVDAAWNEADTIPTPQFTYRQRNSAINSNTTDAGPAPATGNNKGNSAPADGSRVPSLALAAAGAVIAALAA